MLRRDFLLGLAGAALKPGMGDAARGAVAFHYEAVFGPDAVEWYTRFKTLVTGAVLAPSETTKLRRNGTRLIAYEWTSGFYPGDPVSIAPKWEAAVRRKAGEWLVGNEPVRGGAAAEGKPAMWYDFGDESLILARAEHLAETLRESGYDGLFFDTPGLEYLPLPIREQFRRNHPRLDYNRCLGQFLGAVRDRLGRGQLLFVNQGYRHAAEFLPHADLDLTESTFTALDGVGARFRRWHDPTAPWESIRTPMQQLVEPAAKAFPNVRFVHANYSGGGSALAHRAARYSWACAKLWGHDSYLIAPGNYSCEQDDIYFAETGAPAGAYQEAGDVVWRVFERGVAAVNAGSTVARIPGLQLSLPEPQQGYWFPKS